MKGGSRAWVAVLVTLVVQLVLQAQFFPLSELGSDKPLVRIDSPFHQYQMAATSSLCAEGRLGGYDPQLAAGSYVSLATNASAKPQAALACLFAPRWRVVSIYKAVSFAQAVVAPACVAAAAWALGLSAFATLVAGLLAIVMWWTGGEAGSADSVGGWSSQSKSSLASEPRTAGRFHSMISPSLRRAHRR